MTEGAVGPRPLSVAVIRPRSRELGQRLWKWRQELAGWFVCRGRGRLSVPAVRSGALLRQTFCLPVPFLFSWTPGSQPDLILRSLSQPQIPRGNWQRPETFFVVTAGAMLLVSGGRRPQMSLNIENPELSNPKCQHRQD